MSDEALAAMGYKAETLATGDVTLTTRTSVKFFAELLRDQVLERLVRVTNVGSQTNHCHLVALGPDGFFLYTCLRILVEGLGFRHALRAILDADLGFTGACIAPRWRDGIMPWTMAPLAAKPAVLATTATGVPGEMPAPPADSGIDNIPGISRVLDNLKNQARQMVEVELRSQNNASTSRVFKGVITTPTTAPETPETPEGGGVGATQDGGSGKRKSRPAGGGQTDAAGAGRQEEVEGEGRALLFQRRAFQAPALAGGFRPCNRRPGLAPPAGEGRGGALVSLPWGFRPVPSARGGRGQGTARLPFNPLATHLVPGWGRLR
ncbi:unnamed protein product [Ectocarpus sp. CCAP 1310/34]|nr:unnamed protein product [Ectocarpus sp. CCAP 1310/34]